MKIGIESQPLASVWYVVNRGSYRKSAVIDGRILLDTFFEHHG